MQLSRQQLIILVLLTLAWGFNWPVMKLGIADFPPLTFRALSIWLGLPVLGLAMVVMKVPFVVPRDKFRELFWLAFANMFVWHALIIVALKHLSSGRAAILGYTMPIFSALLGAWFFGNTLTARSWVGVGAAALGVSLLLWHELTNLSGAPLAVLCALIGAATWALGTHKLRNTTMPVATLTISFWMTAMTAVVLSVLALLFEVPQWKVPGAATWWSIGYNAVLIFGFAHAAWYFLARSLPPVASSLSVMMIPILGMFSGALGLGEVLHWQDWAAVVLMVVAIGSVLVPTRAGFSSRI
ncbi:DMT family transporter [Polaromonas eurypsychrophila]|uniref:Transporter n=1 Tax=Polaromonas eurypsychrophila TaxID=1614635 RepID=A0A916S8S5_9BURK|nr:DMT family transporter [Polaromonas eurypsychrophila]GGA88929.1 transporter [Polaromonas eurypsychrophila]